MTTCPCTYRVGALHKVSVVFKDQLHLAIAQRALLHGKYKVWLSQVCVGVAFRCVDVAVRCVGVAVRCVGVAVRCVGVAQ